LDEDLEKLHASQTGVLYAAIGKFAVEFEMVCGSMRAVIMTILAKEGLANDAVKEILLADQTSEPLQSLVRSLAAETQALSEKDQKILAAIMNKVQRLTEARNDVLHAIWIIGWFAFEKEGFAKVPGTRLKKNKKGVATQRPQFQADDFNALTRQAEHLTSALGQVMNAFAFNETLEEQLALDSEGDITIIPREPKRF